MDKDNDLYPKAEDGGLLYHGGTYNTINIPNFTKKLTYLYSQWREYGSKYWQNSMVFIVETPGIDNDLRSYKSSILHAWLFRVEFPNTIIIFTKKRIHFLCQENDLCLLNVLKAPISEVNGLMANIEVRGKDGGVAQLGNIFLNAYQQNSNVKIKVGYPVQDGNGVGNLLSKLTIPNGLFESCDVTLGLSELFVLKDQAEIEMVKMAAFLNAKVMDRFAGEVLKDIIYNLLDVSHSTLSKKIVKSILNPGVLTGDLRHHRVNICYPPTVQSGKDFDLSQNAVSNDKNLVTDPKSVIICSIGASYDDFCSSVARTYLIDPTEKQRTAYTALLEAQETLIQYLRVGNSVNMAYTSAKEVVQHFGDEFLTCFTETAGTGIGLEFHESILNINADNGKVVHSGMVFNVLLGFKNLVDEHGNNFSILLGDTVVVDDNGNRVLTQSKKSIEDVTFQNE